MSIQDFWTRIKHQPSLETIELNENGEVEQYPLFRRLFLSIVIILITLLSYGIGRLSVAGERRGPIQIEYDPSISDEISSPQNSYNKSLNQLGQTASVIQTISDQEVVASKNGTKYHYLYCSSAKQIKEENKIIFASAEQAKTAGYTLAANCSPK